MGGYKLIGLMLSLVGIAAVIYFSFNKKSDESVAPSTPATLGTLGALPPSDVGRNPAAARDHSKHQICLASCAAAYNVCKSTATEAPAAEACTATKTSCDSAC